MKSRCFLYLEQPSDLEKNQECFCSNHHKVEEDWVPKFGHLDLLTQMDHEPLQTIQQCSPRVQHVIAFEDLVWHHSAMIEKLCNKNKL